MPTNKGNTFLQGVTYFTRGIILRLVLTVFAIKNQEVTKHTSYQHLEKIPAFVTCLCFYLGRNSRKGNHTPMGSRITSAEQVKGGEFLFLGRFHGNERALSLIHI